MDLYTHSLADRIDGHRTTFRASVLLRHCDMEHCEWHFLFLTASYSITLPSSPPNHIMNIAILISFIDTNAGMAGDQRQLAYRTNSIWSCWTVRKCFQTKAACPVTGNIIIIRSRFLTTSKLFVMIVTNNPLHTINSKSILTLSFLEKNYSTPIQVHTFFLIKNISCNTTFRTQVLPHVFGPITYRIAVIEFQVGMANSQKP